MDHCTRPCTSHGFTNSNSSSYNAQSLQRPEPQLTTPRNATMYLYSLPRVLGSSSVKSDKAMRFLSEGNMALNAIGSHERQANTLFTLRREPHVTDFLGFLIVSATELGGIALESDSPRK
ncbi:hypothetical protein TB2_022969 [Malus domestica]